MIGLRPNIDLQAATFMGKYHNHSEAEIQDILTTIDDPFTGIGLLENKALLGINVEAEKIEINLLKSYPTEHAKTKLSKLISSCLQQVLNVETINLTLNLSSQITAHSQNHAVKGIPNVANIIAVSSGKGGVGKSTVSVNLALSLQQQGARVGILDADIYGPSLPRALNVSDKPEMTDKMMLPLESYGLQIMSIGLMVDQETPMIWRGPMVTQALEQMLRGTAWPELDYLILDLPPGTGDVQLTLAQKTPLAGAVVVTTPQDIALLDVRKALKMFEKVNVPVLGVIENMSSHVCSQCGHEEAIFGEGGGENLAQEYNVPLLGSIPLDIHIRRAIDAGLPTTAKFAKSDECTDAEKAIIERYFDLSLRMAGQLAARKKDYRSLFPKIEISNT